MIGRTNPGRFLFILIPLAALAVAGCGDDGAPQRHYGGGPVSHPPAVTASPYHVAEADPLASSDGLAQDAGDPLTDTGIHSDSDDPLASTTGPKMPTAHSHWLRGRIFDAAVRVRLNGVYLGEFSAPIDKDITMKLHAGVNTVAFTFLPHDAGATARLELVESEHTPPIPALAVFQRSADGEQPPQRTGQTTQTATFFAH